MINIKQLIVLIATVILGLAIFSMIAGSQDSSVYSTVKNVWKSEIQMKTLKGVGE